MGLSTPSLVYVHFLVAMILLNVAGNSLVCLLVLKNKATKTIINWLLFHLAIADLLVAVFFIPPCVVSHFVQLPNGFLGDLLCKFVFSGNLGWVAAAASSFLLVVIAFDRYRATLHPLKTLQSRRLTRMVPVVWVLAALLLLPSIIVSAYDEERQGCVQRYPSYTLARANKIFWSTVNCVLPICMMGYLYIRIALRLRHRELLLDSSIGAIQQSRKRVTKMLLSVSLIFTLCWTPPAALCLLVKFVPDAYTTVYFVSNVSALLNSCINPFVYTLHSQQFRKNLASLMPCYNRKKISLSH